MKDATKPGPEIHNQERGGADDRVSQRLDEFFACRVDPVQILDEDDGDRVART